MFPMLQVQANCPRRKPNMPCVCFACRVATA